MSALGTQDNPLQVAIIGAGPSGFYAAEALFKSQQEVRVTVIDRLPAPFGLVRYGVAPDHPKLKQAILVYQKIAQNPGFSYLGNITVGRDISVDDLLATHDVVIFACGAENDRKLQIPGSDLPGNHTATEFVGWYNGHPDYRDREFDFSGQVAVVIGQGNVAADVCRILAKTVDELKATDISQHALDALAQSNIREIHMVGRRGPVQAKFTHPELRELGELKVCDIFVRKEDLELNPASEAELEDVHNRANIKNYELLKEFSARPAARKKRRLWLDFLLSPLEIRGEARIESLLLGKNRLQGAPGNQWAEATGETCEMKCDLLFYSIGYRGAPIPGVPFDEKRAVLPNVAGRICDGDKIVSRLYTAGWIKRGPTGIIGTNRACAVETVNSLLEDLPHLGGGGKSGKDGLVALASQRGIRIVDYAAWEKIDQVEIERGQQLGKPREKITSVDEMLAVVDA